MTDQIINMVVEYHLIIMIVMLLILMLAALRQKRSNKLLLILILTLTGSIIYEIMLDESVLKFPGRIDSYLNQPGPSESSNPHYYSSPEERYKLPTD
jgi:hypothetical protein